MSQTKSFKEESDPKEDLRIFALWTALIGIIALALWGLYYLFYYLVTFTGNPLTVLFSNIGNILENTIGKVPIIIQFAIIFFMIAGILGFGLLLEDEDDIKLYKALITIIWSIALIVLFALLGIALAMPVPLSLAIGLGFIFFIAPPFVFGLLKGVCYLFELVIADFCHNPFK
jgi:hypothetical protein